MYLIRVFLGDDERVVENSFGSDMRLGKELNMTW